MCSSPKGSTTRRRIVKKSDFSRSEYNEYATMVERASAVYDKIEQEKTERRLLLSRQQSLIGDKQVDVSSSIDKRHSSVFSRIKVFYRNLIYSRNVAHNI